ncbi:MAG: 4Fe-4S binding protein [Bacteroidales bacterium]|nr:4Fe-4S binding protein [Bacteroidales bacterium]
MQDRRKFIHTFVRGGLLTGVTLLGGFLVLRDKDGEFCGLDGHCSKCDKSSTCSLSPAAHFRQSVWQLDPSKCIQCGRCATECVMTLSAVKCTHVYAMCGYCDLCGGYLKPDIKTISTAAENQLCPTNAIRRKYIEEPFFEYEIDEALCIGCGKCVKGCSAFGNGSLQLQVRHDRCVNCNECSIARNCPSEAFSRVPASSPYLLNGIDQDSTKKI